MRVYRRLTVTALSVLVLALSGCAAFFNSVMSASRSDDDPLARRADSLIARLLAAPGSIYPVGDGDIALDFGQGALDDLAALDMHAVPALIDCLSDTRPSEVEWAGNEPVLRGGLCLQALLGTPFVQSSDDSLMKRAALAAGCPPEYRRPCDAYYGSDAATLRKIQATWRNYLAMFRAEGRSVALPPSQLSVGCFVARLGHRRQHTAEFDTLHTLYFELDSLPIPGTVRPSTVALSNGDTIGGFARWSAYYPGKAVYVSWSPIDQKARGPFLSVAAGADSTHNQYEIWRPDGERADSGSAKLTRVTCRQ